MKRLIPLLCLLPAIALADAPRILPEEAAPEILVGLPWQLDDAVFTIDRRGRRAAVARPDPQAERRSIVTWRADGAAPASLQLRGRVVALEFDDAGETLYALARREGRKGPVDAWLTRIDLAAATAARTLGLPVTSTDLALWEAGDALLIAGENEIRSVLLPELRSGPLYRVPGDNGAVAALPGSWEILVGQSDRLLRINLRDRQAREAMPFRDSVALPAAARSLATSPDGRSAWIALDDGTVAEVRANPLSLGESRPGERVVWTGRPAARPQEPVAVVEQRKPAPVADEMKPKPKPEPEPAPVADEMKPKPKPKPEPEPAPVADEMKPKPKPEPEPAPVAEKTKPEPEPDAGAPAVSGQVRGQWSLVRAVVLLGPDSLLDEAARAGLDGQGRWRVATLPPGRYRIVLDGGSDRVLAVRPAFRTVDVTEGTPLRVDDFEVTGTY